MPGTASAAAQHCNFLQRKVLASGPDRSRVSANGKNDRVLPSPGSADAETGWPAAVESVNPSWPGVEWLQKDRIRPGFKHHCSSLDKPLPSHVLCRGCRNSTRQPERPRAELAKAGARRASGTEAEVGWVWGCLGQSPTKRPRHSGCFSWAPHLGDTSSRPQEMCGTCPAPWMWTQRPGVAQNREPNPGPCESDPGTCRCPALRAPTHSV